MATNKEHILFISYDGLTDPLGQSQIIPYLAGMAAYGYRITVLSCEKKQRFKQNKEEIRELLRQFNIAWHPAPFTKQPPILSKFWDLHQLKKTAAGLHRAQGFSMTHCRSYVPAFVGMYLKRKFGVKMLFDMRGFWVDERVDGNIWDLENPIFKLAYRYYKWKEKALIRHSDGIVSLTETGKQELESWESYQQHPSKILVIPCSANFAHFNVPTTYQKIKAKQAVDLAESDLVISYLGSVGTWYLLPEMLDFFRLLQQKYPNAKLLFITPEKKEFIYQQLHQHGLQQASVRVVFANRSEVPFYLSATDINLFFIKPCYSKKASSPVKLGEVLAMGIPVITNKGVGDVDRILKLTDGGVSVNEFTDVEYDRIIDEEVDGLLQKPPFLIRQQAKDYYDLEKAIAQYQSLYTSVLHPTTDEIAKEVGE